MSNRWILSDSDNTGEDSFVDRVQSNLSVGKVVNPTSWKCLSITPKRLLSIKFGLARIVPNWSRLAKWEGSQSFFSSDRIDAFRFIMFAASCVSKHCLKIPSPTHSSVTVRSVLNHMWWLHQYQFVRACQIQTNLDKTFENEEPQPIGKSLRNLRTKQFKNRNVSHNYVAKGSNLMSLTVTREPFL